MAHCRLTRAHTTLRHGVAWQVMCVNMQLAEEGWTTITEVVQGLKSPLDKDKWPVALGVRVGCQWHGVDTAVSRGASTQAFMC